VTIGCSGSTCAGERSAGPFNDAVALIAEGLACGEPARHGAPKPSHSTFCLPARMSAGRPCERELPHQILSIARRAAEIALDAEWRENKPDIASREQPKPAQFSSSSLAMHGTRSFLTERIMNAKNLIAATAIVLLCLPVTALAGINGQGPNQRVAGSADESSAKPSMPPGTDLRPCKPGTHSEFSHLTGGYWCAANP